MANEPYRADEPRQKERLNTADLADAGRAPATSSNTLDTPPGQPGQAKPVQVVHLSRPKEQSSSELEVAEARSASAAATSQKTPSPGTSTATAAARAKEPETGPLFSAEEAAKLRAQWDAIQVGFVDEPRKAVEEADGLVATAMKRLAEQFAEERSKLEGQWDRGGDVSTEDLRLALRRYRSFFGRLLSV